MFAPRVATTQTRGDASSTGRFGQRTSRQARNERDGDHEREIVRENLTDLAAPRGIARDFGQIPLFAPNQRSRSQASSPSPGIIQPKLVVGAVNDPLEHEADRVADQVMRMPDPDVSIAAAPPQVSRKCAACEEEETLQTKLTPSANATATLDVGAAVRATERGGEPLPGALRSYFEPRFGHDFGRVRIHADAMAAVSARALQARAYTIGSGIVFGDGQYAPGTREGRRLLAHELAHVAQQGQAPALAENAEPAGASPLLARVQVAPSAAQMSQRAPLYDTGELKFAPPAKGTTEPFMRAQLDAKSRGASPDITSYNIKGAQPTDEAYVFLETLIWGFGQRTRWGIASRVKMQIGWEKSVSAGAGIIPTGLCTLEIDERGNATAELISPVDTAVAPAAADPIKTLKTTYGVADVLSGDKAPANAQSTPPDPSADWTQTELEDVVEAMGILPAGDRDALKGVLLLRYKTLLRGRAGEFTAGSSEVKMGATAITVIRPASLKLADGAFAKALRFEVGPAGGTPLPGASQTIVHEIGHAVESAMSSSKSEAAEHAVIRENVAAAQLNAANARFAAAAPGSQEQTDASAAAKRKAAAFRAAKATADAAKAAQAATAVPATVTAPLEADAVAKKSAYTTARAAAVGAITAWGAKDVTDSKPYRDAVDAVGALLDDYVKKAGQGTDIDKLDDALVSAVTARRQARADLAKLGANPALAAFDPVDKAQDDWVDAARTFGHTRGRTRRLQRFVDLVKGPPPILPSPSMRVTTPTSRRSSTPRPIRCG
jgi:hypothetical protein